MTAQTPAAETPTEGWSIIAPPAKKAHYFRDTMSLCRTRGFYFGPLNPDDYRSPDDCTACRRVLDREAKVRAEQEREAEQYAREMAAEDGDLDRCEPTL